MGRVAVAITLLVSERRELESLARRRKTAQRLAPTATMTAAETMRLARRNLT